MSERGRSSSSMMMDSKKRISRSRSRVRMSIKKMMKSIGRNSSSSKSVSGGDHGSMTSFPTASNSEITNQTSTSRSAGVRGAAKTTTQPTSLQLVLLLLDPLTRRFELLQLEFDSQRARVSDIIAQIPVSVTEQAVKKLEFQGVIGEAEVGKGLEVRLAEFCKEKEVLVALPKGLSAKECIRLARPILNDSQVLELLNSGGFDISSWAGMGTPRSGGGSSPSDFVARSTERDVPYNPSTENTPKRSRKGRAGTSFTMFAVLVMLAIVTQAVNQFTMSPIQVGVILAPGAKRSKCGLLGYLPKPVRDALPLTCTHSYLEVNVDGTVSVFDNDRTLVMHMEGEVCSTEDCMNGVTMLHNGSVLIGNKRVKKLSTYGKVDLTPFPFEMTPKLKIKKYKN